MKVPYEKKQKITCSVAAGALHGDDVRRTRNLRCHRNDRF